VGDKTASSLLNTHGDLAAIRAAAADPSVAMAAGLRSKINAASDYLDVAPEVVAVRRHLDLGVGLADLVVPGGDEDHPLPRAPESLVELVDRWGLDSSVQRVLAAFTR
jgi:hypothetical protein